MLRAQIREDFRRKCKESVRLNLHRNSGVLSQETVSVQHIHSPHPVTPASFPPHRPPTLKGLRGVDQLQVSKAELGVTVSLRGQQFLWDRTEGLGFWLPVRILQWLCSLSKWHALREPQVSHLWNGTTTSPGQDCGENDPEMELPALHWAHSRLSIIALIRMHPTISQIFTECH